MTPTDKFQIETLEAAEKYAEKTCERSPFPNVETEQFWYYHFGGSENSDEWSIAEMKSFCKTDFLAGATYGYAQARSLLEKAKKRIAELEEEIGRKNSSRT